MIKVMHSNIIKYYNTLLLIYIYSDISQIIILNPIFIVCFIFVESVARFFFFSFLFPFGRNQVLS